MDRFLTTIFCKLFYFFFLIIALKYLHTRNVVIRYFRFIPHHKYLLDQIEDIGKGFTFQFHPWQHYIWKDSSFSIFKPWKCTTTALADLTISYKILNGFTESSSKYCLLAQDYPSTRDTTLSLNAVYFIQTMFHFLYVRFVRP